MRKREIKRVLALALVFVMMMSSVAFAGVTSGNVISNELSATFNVTEVVTSADVTNLAEFKAALANNVIQTINITTSFETAEKIVVNRAITINGNNNTITFTANTSNHWDGDYVIQVYNTTGVTISNLKLTGGDAGLLVNGSTVTLTGAIDVSGNEFGGIESSKGTAAGLPSPSLTVTGATFANTSEAYGKPTIWEDIVTGTVVKNDGQFTINSTVKTGQVQYYIVAAHAVDPNAHIANVTTEAELNAALSNSAKTTINFMNNIAATAPVIVGRQVTINGGGKTLSFTGLEGVATTADDGLIIEANATVNDLVVDAGLLTPTAWVGTYAIHVYDITETVTLNNVTAKNGNGGILVNGSKVTLTGTTTVTGNGFGGIESSQGVGTGLPSLTVAGTLVNGSEAIGLPTIWEDKVTKTVTVTGDELILIGINGQPQYYLDANNAIPVVLSGLNGSINATVGQEANAIITATLKTGVRSVENARLQIEVSKTGIVKEDFIFTSITGGTEAGTPEQNAGWLNDTVVATPGKLTFFWGPTGGTKIEGTIETTANFKFMKAGVYTINMKLVQVGF